MADKRIIVVLGMHSGGTSAIARALLTMGVELGAELIPLNPGWNPKGHWEDSDFIALNNDMLRALDSGWYCFSLITQKNIETLRARGFHLRATELLRTKLANLSIFGIKDPRMTKLLAFWKTVFEEGGFNVSYVLTLRYPVSVAKSLANRDGFDFVKTYLLWLGYVVTALVYSEGSARVLVDYDCLMSEPGMEIRKIAAILKLHLDETELEKYSMEFLDEALRHQNYELKDLWQGAEVPVFLKEVFETSLSVAKGNMDVNDPVFLEQVKIWGGRLDDMNPAFNLLDRANFKLSECDAAVDIIVALRRSLIWKMAAPLRSLLKYLRLWNINKEINQNS